MYRPQPGSFEWDPKWGTVLGTKLQPVGPGATSGSSSGLNQRLPAGVPGAEGWAVGGAPHLGGHRSILR